MILDTTSKTIEVILPGAITTNQLEITADWVDTANGSTFAPGGTSLVTNGGTAVTAVPAPAASTQRQVKALTIYNADTVNQTVTVRMFDGTNRRRHIQVILIPGNSLVFTPEAGWSVVPAATAIIPVCYVYRATTQTVTTTAKITYDATLFDTAGYWDATNFRYTPKTAGYYSVIVHTDILATLTLSAGGALYDSQIQKNGSLIGRVVLSTDVAIVSAAVENVLPNSALTFCNGSTDYIEHWASSNNSTSTTIENGVYASFMAINFVRPA